jgi:hypothetical protein
MSKDILFIAIFVVLWLILTHWVLPRFGVPT